MTLPAAQYDVLKAYLRSQLSDSTYAPAPNLNDADLHSFFAQLGGASFGNFELLLLVYTPNLPDWAAVRAAVNSATGYGVGAVLL